MENKVIPGVLGVFVVICLVGGMLVPIIDGMGEGEPTVNPDAGWIRMNYDTSASTYTITITPGEVGITVSNGSDTQAGADDTIFYADSNVAVWMQDGDVYVLGQNTDGPQFFQPEDPVTITRTADSVAIDDGSTTLTFGTPAWAYVPISSGTFGFFADGVAASTGGNPVAAVGGGFAGVYAYNDITRYAGLGLQLQTVTVDGQITGAYWEKAAAADTLSALEPFDPSSITFDPSIIDIDPIDLGGGSGVGLMSVPTPDYTDGDWGYKLMDVDNVQKAVIVSYSGAGGDIVVPATIGGYDVHRFGLSSPTSTTGTYNVFDNASIAAGSSLTISEGIKEIGRRAAYNGSKFTGTLEIPDSVTSIGIGAFYGCKFTGTLEIPDSVTYLGESAFYNCSFTSLEIPNSITSIEPFVFSSCTAVTSLEIPDSVTSIGASAFSSCTGLTGTLVIPDSVTSIGASAFSSCTGYDGTLVIPDSVTSIGSDAFRSCKFNTIIIASDAIPGSTTTFTTNIAQDYALDLSDTVDYSINRYGINLNTVVQDNIGDSVGYIGSAMSPGQSGLPPSVTGLMFAIPIVIFAACIAVGAAVYLKKE